MNCIDFHIVKPLLYEIKLYQGIPINIKCKLKIAFQELFN